MPTYLRQALFFMFFLSGFCGLLYQVVWLRIAFASFGILTPVLSLVLSTFMMGLGIGSFVGGWICDKVLPRTRLSPLTFYGLIELGIGVSAFAVPALFRVGEGSLLGHGELDSGSYLFSSAGWICASILPWCVLMGATFPAMMAFVKQLPASKENQNSFSFLYLANVIGAMCGTILTAMVFVESFGFRGTLLVAAAFNGLIALVSFVLPKAGAVILTEGTPKQTTAPAYSAGGTPGLALYVLFITGLCSMAMEVVWTRAFTPLLRTTIYAFAGLLCIYLLATWMGSYSYRKALKKGEVLWTIGQLMPWLAITALLPLTLNDPRLPFRELGFVLSVFPFCYLLGYLTPRLIDAYSAGDPYAAGKAYAVNVAGCIVGPLLAGYVLLPALGVKSALVLLALPFALQCAVYLFSEAGFAKTHRNALAALALLLVVGIGWQRTWEDKQALGNHQVHRDHTATVIATDEGGKNLFVNGIGITILATVTKVMAHLPMGFLTEPPKSSLVICFGMGTTFRSLASWGTETTAVELLPSVRDSFAFFHADAGTILANPKNQIIIDDGRRFLTRTQKQFDVITIDPPPPIEAAGSSLLYSPEFYEVVKARLTPHGILQQWFPGGEIETLQAIANSLKESFPYIIVFDAIVDRGVHFLASQKPIDMITAETLVTRMPAAARNDLVEWLPGQTALGVMQDVLSRETTLEKKLPIDNKWLLTDDRPRNEYFVLRRMLRK